MIGDDDIEDWDDFEEVNLSKKRYVSDETIKIWERYRVPQKSIIKQFIKLHGSRYDYSKVEYKNLEKKVIIICKEHGEFLQKPSAHIKNKRSGCIECLNENWIKRFKETHGNRYDYSKFKVNGIIICKIHGEFEQSPKTHWISAGCRRCTRKFKKEEFVKSDIVKQIKELIDKGISILEISRRLDIKYITLYAWIRRGKPFYQTEGYTPLRKTPPPKTDK